MNIESCGDGAHERIDQGRSQCSDTWIRLEFWLNLVFSREQQRLFAAVQPANLQQVFAVTGKVMLQAHGCTNRVTIRRFSNVVSRDRRASAHGSLHSEGFSQHMWVYRVHVAVQKSDNHFYRAGRPLSVGVAEYSFKFLFLMLSKG